MKTQESLQEKMFSLINRWQSSGLSRKAFCERENISYQRLGYWHKKYQQSAEQSNGFMDVEVSSGPNMGGYTLQFPNGVVLHCPSTIPASTLKSLLRF